MLRKEASHWESLIWSNSNFTKCLLCASAHNNFDNSEEKGGIQSLSDTSLTSQKPARCIQCVRLRGEGSQVSHDGSGPAQWKIVDCFCDGGHYAREISPCCNSLYQTSALHVLKESEGSEEGGLRQL